MPVNLAIEDVSFAYGELPVLREINLSVKEGEVVLVGGRSGQGKSTFLEICAGLTPPGSGRVLWDGVDVATMPWRELLRKRLTIGYMFQKDALISNYNVFDNIALPLRSHDDVPEGTVRRKVNLQMEELGLFNVERKYPEMLSAGQLKAVAMARALVRDPGMVLLDEPLSGVDPVTARGMINVLTARCDRKPLTIIMITHNLNIWPREAAARLLLESGRMFPAIDYEGGPRTYCERVPGAV